MRYDLFSTKALRNALIEYFGKDKEGNAYFRTGEPQVRKWITGVSPWPGEMRKAVDEIMAAPEIEKEPPPWWEAAEKELVQEIRVNRKVIRRLLAAGLLEISNRPDDLAELERLVAEQESLESPTDEDQSSKGGSQGGRRGTRRQGPSRRRRAAQ